MHESEEAASKALAAAQMKLFGIIEALKAVPSHSPKTGAGKSGQAPTREEFNQHQERTARDHAIMLEALQLVSKLSILYSLIKLETTYYD